ncbi:deleted in malignant brain tumors 1 protein-like isoform X4 [Dreissena polymorpha]|uniref:deleted in malignant brain tumors 1 protein-like isoform X4 n=1 Tax=Dreissena polymorpha TaxID=45954 RepID=UPI002263B04D|nr:deleted in malignant brain tumors 1 protein-like isoform X4 [Dreissena polymorpha]
MYTLQTTTLFLFGFFLHSCKGAECGGVLTDPFGVITSPNFPSYYSSKTQCTWVIKAPEGSRINVNVTDFEMEHNPKCSFDYLELFNGPNASSPPIGKYCGTAPPKGFESQSNSVGIVFITDHSKSAMGFRMTYTFTQDCPHERNSVNCSNQCHCLVGLCDGVTGACGNGVCKDGWKGTACNETCPQGSYSINCSNHCHCRVGPCDGVTGACGNGGCKDGWTGIACNEKCGGVLTDPFGVITSPNYPSNYSNKVQCIWLINAPEDSRINVNFTVLEMEPHPKCNFDYLELFNGPNASSPSFGKFCVTVPPMVFKSRSNSARIVFSSDSTVSSRGFNLTYTFSVQDIFYMGCYEDSKNRTLADYDYHSKSNSPTECSNNCSHYKFYGVEGTTHCLCGNALHSTTKKPESECSFICPGDRSQICGADWRINIYSHGDCPLGSTGVNCSKQCNCRVNPCDNVTGACGNDGCKDGWTGIACNEKCGGVLTESFGVITSPNYPSDYSRKVQCTWVINAPEDYRINVDFRDFALEYHSDCNHDYLELFNGPNASSPSFGKFCWTAPPKGFTSQSNSARIVFSTDSSDSARGFNLTYTFYADCPLGSYSFNCSKQCHCLVGPCDSVTGACENDGCKDGWTGIACNEKCGGVLTDPFGVITSPNYPSYYSNKFQCTWVIKAPFGSRINVNFTDFEMEPHPKCNFDYLELFNGPNASSPPIGKYCGAAPPKGFQSQSNSVGIVFITDHSKSAMGFRVTYTFTQECGGVLTDAFGVITSPNYPSNYNRQVQCTWDINAPEDYRINVNFRDFALEHHSNCNHDYLELFNGPNASYPSFGKFCGTAQPSGFQSQSNSVRIVFSTDSSDSARGFNLTYTFSLQANISISTTERQHGHSEDGKSATLPSVLGVLGVVLVAAILFAVVYIRRRRCQSARGASDNTDLLTSMEPGNYDCHEMPSRGQQESTY